MAVLFCMRMFALCFRFVFRLFIFLWSPIPYNRKRFPQNLEGEISLLFINKLAFGNEEAYGKLDYGVYVRVRISEYLSAGGAGNVFPPIPSEVILTFGGFLTRSTEMSVVGVILFSTWVPLWGRSSCTAWAGFSAWIGWNDWWTGTARSCGSSLLPGTGT